MSNPTQVDVAIVGGGISGLSLAWYLQQTTQPQDRPLTYALLESSGRWGGKILTSHITPLPGAPFVVEGGPDSFITQKPWGMQLVRELGLTNALLPTNDQKRQVFVLNRGRMTPLPEGVMLIVPTRFRPFALSPLLSPWGKLRMGMELFIPAKKGDTDETLADFIQRRLGHEALDKIAEPLMSGIYNAEAERQSLLATFPRFRDLEQKHGSLIKGMLAARKQQVQQPPSPNGHKPPSAFVSLADGMSQLVTALQARLTGDCRLGVSVQTIAVQPEGGYTLVLDNGQRIAARMVVLATPAYMAARLLQEAAPTASHHLEQIRYVSTGTMSLAFKAEEFGHPLNGFGVVIPRSEKRQINAITWSSTKFNGRAPAGYVLLRAFFGGSRTPQMMELDDGALVATVRRELTAIMGVKATPVAHWIYRWQRANPQYDVGHLERVDKIEQALPAGIFVTGSPYRGVGIPDCIHQAQETAVKVCGRMKG